MKFDTILSNPPFQNRDTRGRTPHKLWIEFTVKELGNMLKEGGLLYQISPSSFRSPSNKILPLMKHHETRSINLAISRHFPTVNSTFASYVICNRPNVQRLPTRVTLEDGPEFEVVLGEEIFYLPSDTNEHSLSIHEKVIFSRGDDTLAVQHDYVNHHNVRLKDADSTLSKVKDAAHQHPVFHTNGQVWWASFQPAYARERKVMWTRSGYTKPFYDDGVHAASDMAYWVTVPSAEAGENLAHNMNTQLMRYIYQSAKWSGFGNERVFERLPALPLDRALSDAEMFDYFDLSEREVAYVTSVTR